MYFIWFLFTADGAGGDVDSNNITDLLNEPGKFLTKLLISNTQNFFQKLS